MGKKKSLSPPQTERTYTPQEIANYKRLAAQAYEDRDRLIKERKLTGNNTYFTGGIDIQPLPDGSYPSNQVVQVGPDLYESVNVSEAGKNDLLGEGMKYAHVKYAEITDKDGKKFLVSYPTAQYKPYEKANQEDKKTPILTQYNTESFQDAKKRYIKENPDYAFNNGGYVPNGLIKFIKMKPFTT